MYIQLEEISYVGPSPHRSMYMGTSGIVAHPLQGGGGGGGGGGQKCKKTRDKQEYRDINTITRSCLCSQFTECTYHT